MSQYQRVEYHIGPDGQITESVIDASGPSCVETTSKLETSLGKVTSREFLDSYHEQRESETVDIAMADTAGVSCQ